MGVINCSNAQWSSGRHVCGMLGARRKVGWGDKFFKCAVVVKATQVRHVGPRPHNGMVWKILQWTSCPQDDMNELCRWEIAQ